MKKRNLNYKIVLLDLNHYENDIQMGDFFYLSDLTCALSQMISNAEG